MKLSPRLCKCWSLFCSLSSCGDGSRALANIEDETYQAFIEFMSGNLRPQARDIPSIVSSIYWEDNEREERAVYLVSVEVQKL